MGQVQLDMFGSRGFGPLVTRSIAALVLGLFACVTAGAQTLSVQGDRLLVDGAPKFIVFTSYFGAMAAANVPADVKYIRSKGFDGIRIWPNFPRSGPQLMRSD